MDKETVQTAVAIAGLVFVIGSGLIAVSHYFGTQEGRTETLLNKLEEDLDESKKNVDGLQGTVGALQGELTELKKRKSQEEPATDQSAATAIVIREPGPAITFSNSGRWGQWSDPQYCPQGHYVCGLKQRVEPPQGGGSADDTAMNAVAFYCCPLNPNENR